MEISELDRTVAASNFKSVYFFYGDETFLMENRIKRMKKKIVSADFSDFNYALYSGKDFSVEDILETAQSYPVMADRKLIVLKNTGVFQNAKSREFKEIKELCENPPEFLCLIICEEKFDKKKAAALKFLDDCGAVVRFDYLSEIQCERWLEKLFEKEEKNIYSRELTAIVRRCGGKLGTIYSEFVKLICYMGERQKVTAEDIEKVVSKSVDVAIYDLLDHIIENRPEKAMAAYRELIDSKTEPIVIISVISSKLSDLLIAKILSGEGMQYREIGKYLDCIPQDWLIKKTVAQSKRFGERYLKRMMFKAASYDLKIKTGYMDKEIALQLLIADLVK